MFVIRFVLVWWGILTLSMNVNAQTDPIHEDWRWVAFTTDSGLPSNNIAQVFETTTGVLWVRTPNGLAWYDGFRWWPVEPEDGLPQTSGVHALPGLNGEVLVVVDDKFYQGDSNGFKHVPIWIDGDTLQVSQVVPLDKERLLIFSEGDLFQYNGDAVVRLSPLPDVTLVTKMRDVVRSRSGRIWSLSSAGLHEWVDGEWVQRILGHGFTDIGESDSGYIALTEMSPNQQGLWGWESNGVPKFKQEASGLLIKDMDVAPNGDAIVGYVSGQVMVRKQGVWTDLTPVPRALLGMRCVKYMDNGDLLVGAESGLFWYRQTLDRWRHLEMAGTQKGAKEQIVSDILKTTTGDVWVASLDGVFVYKKDGTVSHLESALGRSIHAVTGLAEDAQGGIWLVSGGDFDGAFRWHNNAWQHFGRDDGLLASRYHKIMPDQQGQLWFLGLATVLGGTRMDSEQGAFVYDGETFTQWGPQDGLIHGRVYAFAEGPDGALWFGTLGGLSRWLDGVWTHWTDEDGLKEKRIFTLAIDHTGQVWFGHGQNYEYGLGFLDAEGKPQYINVNDGLLGNRVWDIKTAPDGALWIGTRWGGLNRYRDGYFSSFGRDAGLGSLGIWPVLPLEDRVYVGTLGGVYQLNLTEASSPPPKVALAQPVVDVNRVVLRWKVFPYLGELPQEKVETRYRIDAGAWSKWSHVREVGPLSFGSGSHTFTVQSKSLFGNMDLNGTSQQFYISPPFYKHPFFLGMVGFWCVSIAILGVGYWKKQRRLVLEIETRNEELESEIFAHAQVEEKLRNSEDKFRQLLEYIPYGIVLVNKEGEISLVNAQIESLFGYGRDELLGNKIETLMPERFHNAHEKHIDDFYDMPTQRPMGSDFSLFGRRKDGKEFPVDISLGPVVIGNEKLVIGIIVDVTDREKLEEQLRQSQKMEAIGKLAGGVAHDFNNLLTVIKGYSDMLVARIDDEGSQGMLGEISKAGERAASLTRQLLAFSRKQMLQPKVLDVNVILTDTAKMLRRLIGEDIELATVYGATGHIEADPGQLEQVFLNLAVNARDAMPQGGSLTIKTENEEVRAQDMNHHEEVVLGAYVVIWVSDTGIGMNEETQEHIFEPFFTTKEVGKGTGLGLSTVYGIIKQSGGYIFVNSEVGKGTTFKIYFRRVAGDVESEELNEEPEVSYVGNETILLVEDEENIRNFVREVLVGNGYTVLDASNGQEAFQVFKGSERPIHLLLTDVVMPGMSGRDVAEKMQSDHSELKVLFMSGYTDAAVIQHGVIDLDVTFIQKPFASKDLLKKIREVLDEL